MIILTVIFSTLFSKNIDNYPVYYLSGMSILWFFTAAVNQAMMSLKVNKNILEKTATKKYLFVLGTIISEFLNYLITLIILIGVMIATNAPFHYTIIFSVIPIFSLILMLTGLCLMTSIFCVYFSDIQHFWGIITTVLMFSSAIFFPMDIIPEPYRQYLMLNPLYWVIDQFRKFFVYGTIPDLLNMVNLFLLSLIILVLGIIIFKKYEKTITLKL